MGEATERKKRGDYPKSKFKPGVVRVGDVLRYIDFYGHVYELRRGPIVRDPIDAEQARAKAREIGMEIIPEPESTVEEIEAPASPA